MILEDDFSGEDSPGLDSLIRNSPVIPPAWPPFAQRLGSGRAER
jgi:hypothetical protein